MPDGGALFHIHVTNQSSVRSDPVSLDGFGVVAVMGNTPERWYKSILMAHLSLHRHPLSVEILSHLA